MYQQNRPCQSLDERTGFCNVVLIAAQDEVDTGVQGERLLTIDQYCFRACRTPLQKLDNQPHKGKLYQFTRGF